uniref:Uncharacterized protein n=1 Tax=viral metagenome TaxID=1070528 RepID=A0A6C0BBN0_9ZZZZ
MTAYNSNLINNFDDLFLPEQLICGGISLGGSTGACIDTNKSCKNSAYNLKDMRENYNTIKNTHFCPAGYSNVTTNIRMDGRDLKLDKNGMGIIYAKGAACDVGDRNDRYFRGCNRNVLTDENDLAKCYSNRQDRTITSQFANTENKNKYFTAVSKVGGCPRNYKDPLAQDRFFQNYCTKSIANATTNEYCSEWWGSRQNKNFQDDTLKRLCALTGNKRHPKCTCINAPKVDGVKDIVKWALYEPCIKDGYRTSDMKQLTIQECTANIYASDIKDSSINKMNLYQTCSQNASDKGNNPGPSLSDISNGNAGINIGKPSTNTPAPIPTLTTSSNTSNRGNTESDFEASKKEREAIILKANEKKLAKEAEERRLNEAKILGISVEEKPQNLSTTDTKTPDEKKANTINFYVVFAFIFILIVVVGIVVAIILIKRKNSKQNTVLNQV